MITEEKRKEVLGTMLRGFHDSPCVERPSTRKPLKLVKHYYWCPYARYMSLDAFLVRTLTYDIFCYLDCCNLFPILAYKKWQRVPMDFVLDLPMTQCL